GLADASRARAELLVARGDFDAAERLAGAASRRYRLLEQPIDTARAEALAGRALAAAGHRDAALERLEGAYARLADCGARRYCDEVARDLRALGRRKPRGNRGTTDDHGVASLTEREQEIAGL